VKADELVALDTEELNSRLKGARRELYELRFKLAVGQLDDNRQVRKVRKDIARILTVVHARRLAMVPWAEPLTEPGEMVAATSTTDGEQAVEPAEHVSDAAAESSSKETPEHVEAASDAEAGRPARRSRRRPTQAGEEGTDD